MASKWTFGEFTLNTLTALCVMTVWALATDSLRSPSLNRPPEEFFEPWVALPRLGRTVGDPTADIGIVVFSGDAGVVGSNNRSAGRGGCPA